MDIKTYYASLRAAAQEKAARNTARARENRQFRENDNRLAELERDLAFAELEGDREKEKALEREKTRRREENRTILASMGLTERDLSPVYACEKCNDTGFVGTKLCSCFYTVSQSLNGSVGTDAKTLPLVDEPLAKQLGLFEVHEKLRRYAEKFPSVNKKNIYLCGGTGTGKTLLAGDTAARIARRGYRVVFLSSFEMNNVFLKYHDLFNDARSVSMNALLHADLLVIDDLGAEQNFKNVTTPYLLALLNERNLHALPTFITGNLNPDELLRHYGERVFSRIFDKRLSTAIMLGGNDKRIRL